MHCGVFVGLETAVSRNRRQAVPDLPAVTDVSQDGLVFQIILVL